MGCLGSCFYTPFAVRKDISGQYNVLLPSHNTFVVYFDLKADFADFAETHDKVQFE